jgi:hypothetical protein
MTISHDEFELLWAIASHGGVLDCANVGDKEKKLEAEGWIYVEKYDTRARLRASSQLLTLFEALSIDPPNTSFNSFSASQSSEQPDRRDQVSALVGNVVKHSHSGYMAVVSGRQGRRDVFQEYARKLSNQNRRDFWLALMQLSDAEKRKLARDLV